MIIKAKKALIQREIKENIFVTIENKKIVKISNAEKTFDIETDILSPGFIDNHCHGSGGHDFMEANKKAFDIILNSVAKGGATSIFPTAVTQSIENLKKMMNYTSNHKREKGQPTILGIHSEGPCLCVEKKGAQPAEFIIDGNPNILQELYDSSNGKLKVITFAPENDKDFAMLKLANQLGINAQIGHTMANEEDVKMAVKNGAKGITHAYNAMPKSLENETTGFVAKENIYGEIIVDGIHNNKQQVNDFIELKGKDKTILITDSLMCAGMPDGEYVLGGQPITKNGLLCQIKGTKTISGSVASMIDVVKKTLEFTNYSLADVLCFATINVAKYHNLENKGIIAVGADADFVCLDNNLNIQKTITMGEIAYEN